MGSRRNGSLQSVRKLEDGKLLIEASLLLPVIFFVLVLILYFFFYSYESGVAAGILREEVMLFCKEQGNITLDTKQCESRIRERIMEKSLFASQRKVQVIKHQKEMEGVVTSQIEIPVLGAIEIGGFSFFYIEEHTLSQIKNPEEQIWRWQCE